MAGMRVRSSAKIRSPVSGSICPVGFSWMRRDGPVRERPRFISVVLSEGRRRARAEAASACERRTCCSACRTWVLLSRARPMHSSRDSLSAGSAAAVARSRAAADRGIRFIDCVAP